MDNFGHPGDMMADTAPNADRRRILQGAALAAATITTVADMADHIEHVARYVAKAGRR